MILPSRAGPTYHIEVLAWFDRRFIVGLLVHGRHKVFQYVKARQASDSATI